MPELKKVNGNSSNWGRVHSHVATLCLFNITAKGALAYPFQHNDICSRSAGEINWYLQPNWAWEVFTNFNPWYKCRGIC